MGRRALLVIGSRTSEDKYGIESGKRVAAALMRRDWDVSILHASDGRAILLRLIENPPELIVPVGFGAPCEDGQIAAPARLAGVPCAGPTPASGSLMQDKSALSRIVDALFPAGSGVRSPRGCVLNPKLQPAEAETRVRSLMPPLVIKPSFSGSSDGLLVAHTHEEALAAVAETLDFEGKVLVQQLEQPVAHEVSCTVLDGLDGPKFFPIVELRRDGVLVLGAAEKFGKEGLDRHIIPARLAPDIAGRIECAVLTLHQELGSIGLSRTDVLVLSNGEIVILEVNGIPGLLESSIACDAALSAGISFDELCVRYAESAFIPRAEPKIWEILS